MSTKLDERLKVQRHASAARDKVDALEAQMEAVKDIYLRQRGWVHTCMTPGSVWMWTKNIEYEWYSKGERKVESYDALMTLDQAFALQLAQDL